MALPGLFQKRLDMVVKGLARCGTKWTNAAQVRSSFIACLDVIYVCFQGVCSSERLHCHHPAGTMTVSPGLQPYM